MQRVLVVAALGVLAACGGNDTTIAPLSPSPTPSLPPNFGLTDPANGPGACMGDDSFAFGQTSGMGSATDLNCTANDIDIAHAIVKSYSFDGISFTPLPPGQRISCLAGDSVYVETFATLQNNAQDRYDIGVWIAAANNPLVSFSNGKSSNAVTGSCTHYNLTKGAVGVADLDGGDACGDMKEGSDTTVLKLDILKVACEPDAGGTVSIGACVGWQNVIDGAPRVCPAPGTAQTYRYGTTPNNKAKCNCEPILLPIDLKGILRIKKVTVPAGDPTEFTFTPGNWNGGSTFTRTDAQPAFESELLSLGTYTVAETVPASGWTLTGRSCVITGTANAANFTPLSTNGVTVNLGAGQDVTCTFTNTKQATITVAKTCVGGTATFGYTGTVPGGGALSPFNRDCGASAAVVSNTTTFGTYTINESTIPTGWAFTSVSCTGGGANTSTSGAVATVGLDAGENVTCTYTNTKQASITVAKTCVGGTATFGYTGTVPGGGALSPFNRDCAASGVVVSATTTFGTYAITESTVPTGWSVTNLVCTGGGANTSTSGATATVGLDAGEDVTCTFTNTLGATITVAKTCVGGTGATFGYTGTVPGGGALTPFNRDCGASAIVVPVTNTFGAYTINESTIPTGWAFTSVSCTGGGANTSTAGAVATVGLDAGEAVTCTYTNTKQATLIVEKTCTGGTATFGYTGTVPGGGALAPFNRDCGASAAVVSNTTTFGSYTVNESTIPAGWAFTSLSCTGGGANTSTSGAVATVGLDAGETVTCTYTNTKQATIIVAKTCVGGTATFGYTGTVPGGGALSPFNRDCAASAAVVSNTTTFGSYTITESTLPTGWSLTNLACTGGGANTSTLGTTATVGLDAGETVTCTFTNTLGASITVAKTCVGGTGATFGYTGTVPGGGALTPFNRDCGASAVVVPVTSTFGTYTINESTIPTGWAFTSVSCTGGGANTSTSGAVATVGLDAGEAVTCTYTNTKQATITVAKTCVGGAGATFGYTGTVPGGGALSPFNRDCGASAAVVSNTSTFGTYTIDETTIPTGWAFTSLSCTGGGANTSNSGSVATVGLDAGESVTCTYTNTKQATITVAKTCVGGTGATFGYTGTVPGGGALSPFNRDCGASAAVVSNTSTFGTYTIDESTIPSGWTFTSLSCTGGGANTSSTGSAATVGLDAGESVTCTYTNTKLGKITIIKDVQNPATDAEDFTFSTTGSGLSGPFDLDDDGEVVNLSNTKVFNNVPLGAKTVTEAVEANFTLTAITCTGGGANTSGDPSTRVATIGVDAGEDITCTFVNQRKARLIIEKELLGGGVQVFDFSRTGIPNFTLTNGQSNNSGFTLAPGSYTTCELTLAVSWKAAATAGNTGGSLSSVTLVNPDFPQDFGNRCYSITLGYGDDKTVHVVNSPPPGGNARTIGYWKNWSSCAQSNGGQFTRAVSRGNYNKTLDGNLPQTVGILLLAGDGIDADNFAEGCANAVNILDKSDLSGKKRASDAAYNLAAQLLAAMLNVTAGAGTCPAATAAISGGQALLAGINFNGVGAFLAKSSDPKYAQANAYAETLDKYNNNTLCF